MSSSSHKEMKKSDSLFKALLNVVRLEASDSLGGNLPKSAVFPAENDPLPDTSLQSSLEELKKELQTTNQLDCNIITGHFLKAMVRILQGQNIAQTENQWEKHQMKLIISCVDCLVLYFGHMKLFELSKNNQQQTSQLNSSNINSILSISYMIALISEHLKVRLLTTTRETTSHSEPNKLSSKMIFHADYEYLMSQLCQLIVVFFMTILRHYQILVEQQPSSLTTKPTTTSLLPSVQSYLYQLTFSSSLLLSSTYSECLDNIAQHILSQLVHTTIIFITFTVSHSAPTSASSTSTIHHQHLLSKTIVLEALQALEQFIVTFGHYTRFWRQSLPGIFSGLCKLLHSHRGNAK